MVVNQVNPNKCGLRLLVECVGNRHDTKKEYTEVIQAKKAMQSAKLDRSEET